MGRLRGIWIVALLVAAAGAAAVGVHRSAAAPSSAATHASTIDNTYSCRVRRQHFVVFDSSVTLPPIQSQPQPGILDLTTVAKSVQKNGVTITLVQLGLTARKNSLRVDKSTCKRVSKKISLKSKGLSGPPEVITPSYQGRLNQRCGTTDRVLVRLRLETKAGVPTQALLAVRDDDSKRKPVAFYTWTPKKVTSFTENGCVDLS